MDAHRPRDPCRLWRRRGIYLVFQAQGLEAEPRGVHDPERDLACGLCADLPFSAEQRGWRPECDHPQDIPGIQRTVVFRIALCLLGGDVYLAFLCGRCFAGRLQ